MQLLVLSKGNFLLSQTENGSRHKQLARDIPGSYSKLVYLIGFLINGIIVGFLINGIMIFLTISTLSW